MAKGIKHAITPPLSAAILLLVSLSAMADDPTQTEAHLHEGSEIGVELGALTIIGIDFRATYRRAGSPFLYGFRYLDTKDDHINESAYGFPGDSSDKIYERRSGFYLSYLFRPAQERSFYVGGALYSSTIKLECSSVAGNMESDSETSASLLFSGGLRGRWGEHVGYNVGMLFSPFSSSTLATSTCSEERSGEMDIHLSLTYSF